MKDKMKNYGFWMSLISAILIAVQAMGFKFDMVYVNEIITAFLGVLVVLGIISNPKEGKFFIDKSKKIKEKENDDKQNQ